jgi:hypothetical protein
MTATCVTTKLIDDILDIWKTPDGDERIVKGKQIRFLARLECIRRDDLVRYTNLMRRFSSGEAVPSEEIDDEEKYKNDSAGGDDDDGKPKCSMNDLLIKLKVKAEKAHSVYEIMCVFISDDPKYEKASNAGAFEQ